MKKGDLVKWTFGKGSGYNKQGNYHIGVLLKKQTLPVGSWVILLQGGSLVHGDKTEIEVINEN
jgi:hypothetical protein